MAFEVSDMDTREPKNDPNIVRWLGVIEETDSRGYNRNTTYINTHRCTADDKKKFFKASDESRATVENFLKNDSQFFCLDNTDWRGKPV